MVPSSLLRKLLEKLCPHSFSWPHTGGHGHDYQVCLICGSVYEYDCVEMRRTGRLLAQVNGEYAVVPGGKAVR